ncbi:MerR family transcriptional regulator [Naasia lichenicola]|uniref:MerR family transcriptional regulator n=1 Tax=Naasia lichenicola TaxID=2565933 RepID=A0A4S4FP33_9MICO|nr:MerR family transcriptional regulator [Naasia lichenicola]THG31602.1 MerR family transcriptional regulator [Naasia lichenicola]
MTQRNEDDKGVYGIAVAAEMAGIGEQALRLYERRGLLTPDRTAGGTRRYSVDDVTILRRVAQLLGEGLNLAGARRVLELEEDNRRLEAKITRLMRREVRGPDRS